MRKRFELCKIWKHGQPMTVLGGYATLTKAYDGLYEFLDEYDMKYTSYNLSKFFILDTKFGVTINFT